MQQMKGEHSSGCPFEPTKEELGFSLLVVGTQHEVQFLHHAVG